jgi:hypothetical protein
MSRSNQKPKAKFDALGWWKAFSLPPEPPPDASFKQRDIFRRAQLASILLFAFVIVTVAVLAVFLITNPTSPIVIALAVLLVLMLTATYLNRKEKVNVAGAFMAGGVTLVLWGLIFKSGLAPENLGFFDLLVYPELFAASLLPINWVFAWALANSVFVILAFTYAPRTHLMAQILATSGPSIIEKPIQLQILVSVVLWLWIRSATNAIKRADRAEEISKLQRVVADQMLEKVNQKRQLDTEIQQIELVLDQSAIGNLDARVALQSGNVLWSISGKLNNLISRFKRIIQEQRRMQNVISQHEKLYLAEQKYQRLVYEVGVLARTMQQAQNRHQPVQIAPSGTPLDTLLQSINGKYISEHSQESSSTNEKKEMLNGKKEIEIVDRVPREDSSDLTRIPYSYRRSGRYS